MLCEHVSESTGVGVGVGVIGIALSFLGKHIVPGRAWGDPMPVILSIAQLTRGFLYWNWRSPLIHLLFLLGLALLVVWVMRLRGNHGDVLVLNVIRAGRLTAVINVLIIAVLETDAVIVGTYYLISGVIASWVTGEIAGFLAKQTESVEPTTEEGTNATDD
jgi:hypothetical protein